MKDKPRMTVEYRVVKPVDFTGVGRSAVSREHSLLPITLTVRKIFGIEGKKEVCGRSKKIVCSVTNISNDKANDGMVIIHGQCPTLDAISFEAVITHDNIENGYGLLTVPN